MHNRAMRVAAMNCLRRERRAAAATSRRVWILEGKAGAHHVRHVIDFDAVQILRAEHIDEQAHAFFVEHKIALA